MSTNGSAGSAAPAVPASSPGTRVAGRLVAAALVVGVGLAGVWGVTADRSEHHAEATGPAVIGEPVAISGGTVKVDRVNDQAVGAMGITMSGPGMSLQGQKGGGMPHVHKGYRRIGVEVTVAANVAMRVRASDFRLSGAGMPAGVPEANDLDRAELVPGTARSGTLAYSVPKDARRLTLSIHGAERPIALSLGAAHQAAHGH